MKELLLNQGKVCLLDDSDYEALKQYHWISFKSSGAEAYYAKRFVGPKKNRKQIFMHREIMGVTDPNMCVDHIDRNGLNNQRVNLRIATKSQNCANRKAKVGSSSKYLGVGWHKVMNKWYAKSNKNWLGFFESENEAALAYNEGAIKNHGEFARLNIIDS